MLPIVGSVDVAVMALLMARTTKPARRPDLARTTKISSLGSILRPSRTTRSVRIHPADAISSSGHTLAGSPTGHLRADSRHSLWRFRSLHSRGGGATRDELHECVGATLRRRPIFVPVRAPRIGILEKKLRFDAHECSCEWCCEVGLEARIDVIHAVRLLSRLELQEGSDEVGYRLAGHEDRTLVFSCVRLHATDGRDGVGQSPDDDDRSSTSPQQSSEQRVPTRSSVTDRDRFEAQTPCSTGLQAGEPSGAMVSRLVGGAQVGHAADQGLCGFWTGRGREMAARFVGDTAGRLPGTIASWPSTRFSTKSWRFPSRSVRRSPLRSWRVSGLNRKRTRKPLIEPGRRS